MHHNIKYAPYGSWQSPINEEIVAEGSLRLSDISVINNTIYWIEGRPEEKGRFSLVSYKDDKKEDFSPKDYNIRSKVHEYGGLSYVIDKESLYFVHFSDQFLYKMDSDGSTYPIIEEKNRRFASFVVSKCGKYLFCVMEDHTDASDVKNCLVCIDIKAKSVKILACDDDFYGEVAISPDGKQLAWISWNHPDMPWDSTNLFIGQIRADGSLEDIQKIASNPGISVLTPLFSPDNILYYACDETGYWNFYLCDNNQSRIVSRFSADVSEPLWVLGVKRADFINYQGKTTLACIYTEEGIDRLALIDVQSGLCSIIDTPFTSISSLRAYKDGVVFIAASPTSISSIIYIDLVKSTDTVIFSKNKPNIDDTYYSIPIPIKYDTTDGAKAYGIYYPPCNPHFQAKEKDSKPPLLVRCHGGPTSHKKAVLDLTHQYFTSRGYGVVEVNYRGSSGYGKAYREMLFTKWGVACVDDAIYAAMYLINNDLVSRENIAVIGGSAGGYTVLAALAFRNFFKAGVSYYGVSDIEALAKETHKFEAHYLDKLIAKEKWKEFSPIHYVNNIKVPLLILQGKEDKIVPPSQSEAIHHALKKNHIPTTYILFPHEQHGFRSKEAIMESLKAENKFYHSVFGLEKSV
ncbi:MAG: S9 family peptidase [Chlamydiae bacterium]|nr:S9 family peptidase [Chlamydiota bacterium]